MKEVSDKEQIEMLARIIVKLLEHAPLPQSYYGMTYEAQDYLEDINDAQNLAERSNAKRREARKNGS